MSIFTFQVLHFHHWLVLALLGSAAHLDAHYRQFHGHIFKMIPSGKQIISIHNLSGQIVYLFFLLHLKPMHMITTIIDFPCDFPAEYVAKTMYGEYDNGITIILHCLQHVLYIYLTASLLWRLWHCLYSELLFQLLFSVSYVCCFNNYSWAQRKSKQEKLLLSKEN